MSRKLSAFEMKAQLASMCRVAPDDVDGYVVLLSKGAEVTVILSNSGDECTLIGLLGRAVEQRAAAVGKLEDKLAAQ